MIRPTGFLGAAFGDATDGDARSDAEARKAMAVSLGITTDWAFVSQIHGNGVVEAMEPGSIGEADALFSAVGGLPMTVATADCVPIILEGESIAAVIHAGWRGLDAGVIPAALRAIGEAGHRPDRAAIGPAIGPCCYEVGADVADRFPDFLSTSSAHHLSLDLRAVAAAQLGSIVAYRSEHCTRCESGYHSYRRDATTKRQVAVAWLPED